VCLVHGLSPVREGAAARLVAVTEEHFRVCPCRIGGVCSLNKRVDGRSVNVTTCRVLQDTPGSEICKQPTDVQVVRINSERNVCARFGGEGRGGGNLLTSARTTFRYYEYMVNSPPPLPFLPAPSFISHSRSYIHLQTSWQGLVIWKHPRHPITVALQKG